MFKNYVKHVIQKNRNLFTLLKKDEEAFFEGMKVQYKKNNEVVFRKGTTVQRLLIVMEGKLKKSRSANYLAEAGQTWGEVFLNEAAHSRLEDDVIVETESVLIELSLMGIKNIQAKYESLALEQPQQKSSRKNEVNPQDIQFLYELDKGNESRSLLLKFQDKLFLGKLYKKKDL
jgi:cGMP-dependent protein kinase